MLFNHNGILITEFFPSIDLTLPTNLHISSKSEEKNVTKIQDILCYPLKNKIILYECRALVQSFFFKQQIIYIIGSLSSISQKLVVTDTGLKLYFDEINDQQKIQIETK